MLNSKTRASSKATRFAAIGDYGLNNVTEGNVSALVNSWAPEYVITLGDNSYGNNDIDDNIGQFYANYIGNYSGAYGPGSPTTRFFPSIGNHDYTELELGQKGMGQSLIRYKANGCKPSW